MSVGETIALALVVWHVMGFFIMTPIMLREEYYGAYLEVNVLNPVYIYRHTECNIFGVICLTILINLLCPIMSVCYWFYKLCTVGRR